MGPDVPVPEVPTTLIGALALAVTALAGVIVYLWRFYQGRMAKASKAQLAQAEKHAEERQQWALERQRLLQTDDDLMRMREELETRLRAEFEEKHRRVVDDVYRQAREDMREARKDFAEIMGAVQSEASKSSEKLAAVMDKFYDRYVGPRRTY